jgi:hypothetical protein
MQKTPTGRRNLDGGTDQGKIVGFVDGVDSFSQPMQVKPTQCRWLENGVTRGALIQVRPGLLVRFKFDVSPNTIFWQWWTGQGSPILFPQMLQAFKPTYGPEQVVFCISGSVWFALLNPDGSIQQPQLISANAFCPTAPQVIGCPCVQTATIFAGTYTNNITPRNILMLGDGINAQCSWDGAGFQAYNPVKRVSVDVDGNTLFTNGYNETPVGLIMEWSGNRLWVFNGPIGRASDLNDPTHFTEEMIATSGGAWVYPQNVTAAIDRGISGTTNSALFVYTRDTTWAMATGVINRLPNSVGPGWIGTANFQTKMFSGVGCVAAKSPIVHRGLLYWMSQDGIVVFDSTGTVFSTQNLPPIDQEMAYSRRAMCPNMSSTCAGYRDSYVFWGVPVGPVMNGRPCNGHIQVLDRQTTVVHTLGLNGPYTYGTIGWQGVWTGMRPVEWATVDVAGVIRPYALSMDQDGVIRIWEAFQGNRADNGQPIPWLMETRTHPAAPSIFETSLFRSARALLDQMLGDVTCNISWRGMRGQYHAIFSGSYTATPGSVLTPDGSDSPIKFSPGAPDNTSFESYTVQTRDVISQDDRGPQQGCSAAGVESQWFDNRDHCFSLLFQMTGRAAIVGYRIAVDDAEDTNEGQGVSPNEQGFNIVPEAACPENIPGITPPYLFQTTNQRDAFTAMVPTLPTPTLYQAPAQ